MSTNQLFKGLKGVKSDNEDRYFSLQSPSNDPRTAYKQSKDFNKSNLQNITEEKEDGKENVTIE